MNNNWICVRTPRCSTLRIKPRRRSSVGSCVPITAALSRLHSVFACLGPLSGMHPPTHSALFNGVVKNTSLHMFIPIQGFLRAHLIEFTKGKWVDSIRNSDRLCKPGTFYSLQILSRKVLKKKYLQFTMKGIQGTWTGTSPRQTDRQMADRHLERCPAPWTPGEVHVRTIMRYDCTLTGMAKI